MLPDVTLRRALRRPGPTGRRTTSPEESLPPPAPPGPYSTSLSAFDLTDPNGEWQLYVNDDHAGKDGLSASPCADPFTLEFTADTSKGRSVLRRLPRLGA